MCLTVVYTRVYASLCTTVVYTRVYASLCVSRVYTRVYASLCVINTRFTVGLERPLPLLSPVSLLGEKDRLWAQ